MATFLSNSLKDTPTFQVPASAFEEFHYSGHVKIFRENGSYVEIDNGSISFGVTTIFAKKLRIYLQDTITEEGDIEPKGTGIADGNVKIIDSLGDLYCSSLRFNYVNHTGSAEDVVVQFDNLKLHADHMKVFPQKWLLDGVSAFDPNPNPKYEFKVKSLSVQPGIATSANQVGIYLFGKHLITLPRLGVNLNRKVIGLSYPTPSFNPRNGLGFTFGSSILLDNLRVLGAGANINSGQLPSYSAELSRSEIRPDRVTGLVSPSSDLDERFTDGYFDKVDVLTPLEEAQDIGPRKDTLTVGTYVNQTTFDRLKPETFTLPYVFTYEHGSIFSHFANHFELQIQNIAIYHGEEVERGVLSATLAPLKWQIGPHTLLQTRLDGKAYIGQSGFGWLRSEFGFSSLISSHIRIGGSYFTGNQYGQSTYLSDELYATRGFMVRGDFAFGPRTLSIIEKYDMSRKVVYDQEIRFSQLMGLFEPYISYASFPSSIRFGFQIRTDSILNQLKSRDPRHPVKSDTGLELKR